MKGAHFRKLAEEDLVLIRGLLDERQRHIDTAKRLEQEAKLHRLEANKLTLQKIAEKFDISEPNISRIKNFETWVHVKW